MPIADLCTPGPDNMMHPVPGWALFVANIGVQVAAVRATSRTVVLAALPTRAFAAALVASGFVGALPRLYNQ